MRYLILFYLSIMSISVANGQTNAQKPISFFDFKYYQVPGQGRMIETYTKILGSSVQNVAIDDSTTQAEVLIQMVIADGDKVIDYTNSSVKGPRAVKGYSPDFIDIQRFLVPKGDYTIELSVKDVNRPDVEAVTLEQPIHMTYDITKCSFSDIELVAGMRKAAGNSSISKSGLDMIPYMANLYGDEFNEIIFYFELYSTEQAVGKGEPYLLRYSLKDKRTDAEQINCTKVSRETASQVKSELGRFDISQLRSGAYTLHLEALDRDNRLIAEKKMTIVRQNNDAPALSAEQIDLTFVGAFKDKDSLITHIRSLTPIAVDNDLAFIDMQLSIRSLQELKSWFYDFWEEKNPVDPSQEWADYKLLVREAEEQFGTRNKEGYRTDMGTIYCKYGRPNSVVDDSMDSESYPYQIWHYYKAGRFSGGRFVFYDTSLMQSDYALLHSDVRGERQNPRWNRIIHSRNNSMNSFEQNDSDSESGRRLQELYDSPR